jgi:putative component of toxin-antitoxin plasmid stabilization module
MFEVRLTEEFQAWLGKLRDDLGKAKITCRIRRLGREMRAMLLQ